MRGPVTETLEHGSPDDGRPPPSDSGLLARFIDWYADRRSVVDVLGPAVTGLGVAIVAVLAVGATTVARYEPPPPQPTPSPPPTAEQLAERRRVAFSTAKFAETQQCNDRIHVTIEVLEHAPDWSSALMEVNVAAGTPEAGQLVLEVKPFEIGVSYVIVSATGSCRP